MPIFLVGSPLFRIFAIPFGGLVIYYIGFPFILIAGLLSFNTIGFFPACFSIGRKRQKPLTQN